MKTIRTNSGNIHKPLSTLDAFQGCALTALFTDIPDCLSAVQVTVITPKGEILESVPATQKMPGEWIVHIPPFYFDAVGCGEYEVWALNCADERTAIGKGKLCVMRFASADMTPVSPTGRQIVTAIPDRSGRLHNVVAEEVDGEYTWVIED